MLKKQSLILVLFVTIMGNIHAQKEVRSFIFGHSLINHEWEVDPPTPSQETSVPHWMHFLAEASGHQYAVSGQYGFLLQHANLPPIAQWGFDFVEGAWESDTEEFSEADFTNILITPANFVQWQGPDVNYPGEDMSPLDATNTIIDWCMQEEEDLQIFIYENWPDMGPYLSNGFPPTEDEWNNYLEYLNGDFHDWFLTYYDAVKSNFPDACVRMIPVGPIINNLVSNPLFAEIPITELYEDDAPHGRATIYFLASLVTYTAMYGERPTYNYVVDKIVHPLIREYYLIVVDYIWLQLRQYDDDIDVFCPKLTSLSDPLKDSPAHINLSPNPTSDMVRIENLGVESRIQLYDARGVLQKIESEVKTDHMILNISSLQSGIYYLIVDDEEGERRHSERIIRL